MATPICESKKIGDVNLKGIIDGIEIQCNIDIACKKSIIQESKGDETVREKLTTKKIFLYFILPFLIIPASFMTDFFIDENHHLTLFISPITVGFIIYKMIKISPTSNIDHWKKIIDTLALLFSTLSVSIFIFKTINVENPYLNYIISLNNDTSGIMENVVFYFIMILTYFIIFIFSSSITIKTLFTFDELKSMKK